MKSLEKAKLKFFLTRANFLLMNSLCSFQQNKVNMVVAYSYGKKSLEKAKLKFFLTKANFLLRNSPCSFQQNKIH